MTELIRLVAQYFILVPILATIVLMWQLKTGRLRARYIIVILATGILALVFAKAAGLFIHDPRPFVVGHFTPLIAHAADNGFPSDHTLLAASLAFAALLFSRTYGGIIALLALLIGASRVLAGVHHWTDILGSFVISAIAAVIVFGIYRTRFHVSNVDDSTDI